MRHPLKWPTLSLEQFLYSFIYSDSDPIRFYREPRWVDIGPLQLDGGPRWLDIGLFGLENGARWFDRGPPGRPDSANYAQIVTTRPR